VADIGIEQAGGFAGVVALIGVVARWVQHAGRRGDQQSAEAWERMVKLLAKAEETLERERTENRERIERLEASANEERRRREEGDAEREAMRAELGRISKSHASLLDDARRDAERIAALAAERDEARDRLVHQLIRAVEKQEKNS
jgi:hypothetical protein